MREDWRKGLQTVQIPTGIYSTKAMWRCRNCSFEGDVFGTKKPYDVDLKVRTAAESGVKYRWMFLAKSHVKVKSGAKPPGKDGDMSLGCVFCVGEGKGTGIFGNVETLCEHLVAEHGGMNETLMVGSKAIVGRVADDREEFDVNIP